MTKQHFQVMADIVKSILQGDWTNDLPIWALPTSEAADWSDISGRARAIQTAEAFIYVAERFNPRFDRDRFLVACGLKVKPAKVRKARTS